MRICINDRVFEGTALQIVKQLRDQSPLTKGDSIVEYVKVVVEATYLGEGIRLQVRGENDEALAAGLLEELIRHNLATKH